MVVVGVSLDARRPEVEQFVRENQLTYPVIFTGQGSDNAIALKYRQRAVNNAILIGRDGKLLLAPNLLHGGLFTPAGVDAQIETAIKFGNELPTPN